MKPLLTINIAVLSKNISICAEDIVIWICDIAVRSEAKILLFTSKTLSSELKNLDVGLYDSLDVSSLQAFNKIWGTLSPELSHTDLLIAPHYPNGSYGDSIGNLLQIFKPFTFF